jgi:peptidoglycan biosynthesis protein MviN/MurJ (putative lipid II flippase)
MLAINTVVSIELIPKLGLVGAALGMLVAYAFVVSARLIYGYKHYHLHPFGNTLFWPLITAAVTAVVFYGLQTWLRVDSLIETAIILVIMTLFYAGFYFLRATEPEEKHLINRLLNKIKKTPAVMNT